LSKKKLAGIIVACTVGIIVVTISVILPQKDLLSASVTPLGAGPVSPWGGEYESDVQVTLTASPPNQPTNISPAGGAHGINSTPTLQSSAFSDPDMGDTHAASQWQIRTILGSYSSDLVFDSGADTIDLTSITVPSGRLSSYATYDWHVRYEDNHGAWSDWSAETSFTTSGLTGLTRWCFIATAAYGTPMAGEVQILREFRDEYLLTNPPGRAFVDFYYRVSPPMAEFITEHPSLKPIVRVGLAPAVVISTVAVKTTPAEKMAIAGLLVLISVAVAVWVTRWRGRGLERAWG
jgi:hypothetical protein